MEGDDNVRIIFAMLRNFNPLPPYGGRPKLLYKHIEDFHFNPLPPYGGRLAAVTTARFTLDISIHSLRMEGDHSSGKRQVQFPISIHSLRMEGDWNSRRRSVGCWYFNPLPPYGGRLLVRCIPLRTGKISIHSLRMEGDSRNFFYLIHNIVISIHSLRMEGDDNY